MTMFSKEMIEDSNKFFLKEVKTQDCVATFSFLAFKPERGVLEVTFAFPTGSGWCWYQVGTRDVLEARMTEIEADLNSFVNLSRSLKDSEFFNKWFKRGVFDDKSLFNPF